MIVKNKEDLKKEDRIIEWGNGLSHRFLLKKDNMGYSLTETHIDDGSESFLEYTNHLEACYCIEGTGEVECDGKVYPLKPGTIYALDNHEAHILRGHKDLKLVCVFSPALVGNESHKLNPDGSSSY